jgi:hypothetical protein
VTIDHKFADSPRAAVASLKKFLPIFFSRTISSHWHKYRDQFELHAFLDVPGSRGSRRPTLYRHDKTQAPYHHHAVLLLSHSLSQRFQRKCLNLLPDDPSQVDEAEVSDFRRSFMHGPSSFKLLQFMTGHAVLNFRNTTTVRSCCVQPLDEREDIERASTYAAKSFEHLSKRDADNAYLIFPLYGLRGKQK